MKQVVPQPIQLHPKGILMVLMLFIIAFVVARPQFVETESQEDGVDARHLFRPHSYNYRRPFMPMGSQWGGQHFGSHGGGLMPFGSGNFGPTNQFVGQNFGGGSSATGLGMANSGIGGVSAIGLGSANAGNGASQATGIGIANAPVGGFGVGMGLGLAVATPFGNIAQSQGQAFSFG